jgi:hypothetical protein
MAIGFASVLAMWGFNRWLERHDTKAEAKPAAA